MSRPLAVVRSEPSVDSTRIAAIGYCFGATVAPELARTGADIRAVVGFHSGLTNIRPDDSRNIKGPGAAVRWHDPLVPLEHRVAFEAEMGNAGVPFEVQLYGGVQHSFTHARASDAGLPGIAC